MSRAYSLLMVLPLLTTLALAPTAYASKGELCGVINLNTATLEQLTMLPGIGPKKAEAILALRAKRPFKAISDFKRVKGIGPKTFRALQAHLAVAGETTLARGGKQPTSESPPAHAAPARVEMSTTGDPLGWGSQP